MQLNLKQLFERSEKYLSDNEIVSRRADGSLFRYHYADYARRVRCLADALASWLSRRFAKWWLPDHYVFIDALPKTGVGKINKRRLREQVADDVASGVLKLK